MISDAHPGDDAATEPVLHVPPREIPAPRSLSPKARAALALRPPAPPFPEPGDLAAWRELAGATDPGVEEMLALITGSVGARVTDEVVGGVPSYVAVPQEVRDGADAAVCMEIHGGALYTGGGAMARALAGAFADIRQLQVVSVEYRMPPDHPFPAALDDCLAVYRALLDRHGASNVVVTGASAGGNLAAALVLRARDEGLPLPAGAVLLSPEVDLTESGDSFATLAGIDTQPSLMPVNELYANGHDLAHPYLSPLFGDFTRGFPPTFLQSGTRDLFLSNTVRMHRALRAAGVPVECHVFEARPHLGFGGLAAEDFEVMGEVNRFLDAVLSGARSAGAATGS